MRCGQCWELSWPVTHTETGVPETDGTCHRRQDLETGDVGEGWWATNVCAVNHSLTGGACLNPLPTDNSCPTTRQTTPNTTQPPVHTPTPLTHTQTGECAVRFPLSPRCSPQSNRYQSGYEALSINQHFNNPPPLSKHGHTGRIVCAIRLWHHFVPAAADGRIKLYIHSPHTSR